MTLARRSLFALAGGAAVVAAAGARAHGAAGDDPLIGSLRQQRDPDLRLPLWPQGALPAPPAGLTDNVRQIGNVTTYKDRNRGGITMPDLSIFRAPRPNGAAVLLIPGGAYERVGIDREGEDVARGLNTRGYSCGVLAYRLPHEGWADGWEVPLADAQRAMRLLAAQGAALGFAPDAVHVLGFSAGGHLAATLALDPARAARAPADALDRTSARPASLGLLYPVITMDPAATHAPSRRNLIGAAPSEALVARFSLERHVTPACPPAFLLGASDDKPVPIANSYRFAAALAAARVPHALHVFDQGGHGFGLRLAQDRAVAGWLRLYLDWLARQTGGTAR